MLAIDIRDQKIQCINVDYRVQNYVQSDDYLETCVFLRMALSCLWNYGLSAVGSNILEAMNSSAMTCSNNARICKAQSILFDHEFSEIHAKVRAKIADGQTLDNYDRLIIGCEPEDYTPPWEIATLLPKFLKTVLLQRALEEENEKTATGTPPAVNSVGIFANIPRELLTKEPPTDTEENQSNESVVFGQSSLTPKSNPFVLQTFFSAIALIAFRYEAVCRYISDIKTSKNPSTAIVHLGFFLTHMLSLGVIAHTILPAIWRNGIKNTAQTIFDAVTQRVRQPQEAHAKMAAR